MRTVVENFALLDQTGRFHELYYYSNATAIVLFVQGNGCPIVRNSLDAFEEVRERFEGDDVIFLMLNPNSQDTRQGIAQEAEEFGIDLPILVDETQVISHSLGITRTAEAILIDPSNWEIAYRGPLDDRLGYGTQKQAAQRHFLVEALHSMLAGEDVDVSATPLRGCLVSFPARDGDLANPPSYSRDIVPILERKCVVCHREGGIGPWAMTSYREVRGWSSMMREVIQTRRMPPWQADSHVGSFSNDLSMTVEETQTLVHWLEVGAPRGEGPDGLEQAPASFPNLLQGEPDLVISAAPQEIPATGLLDNRYLEVEVPIEEDVWVVGGELRFTNPQVVHHGFTIIVYPPGYEGDYPTVGPDEFPITGAALIAYAPGTQAQAFPEGTGRFIPTGARIIFNMHYITTGRPEVDVPSLALYFADEPPAHELRTVIAQDKEIRIPPGVAEYELSVTHKFERDVLLYNIYPHMHYRGRWMNFVAEYPDGSEELLLAVPSWDFYWQRFYKLSQPKFLPAETEIHCHAAFDNSAQNARNPDPSQWVTYGSTSEHEMLVGYMDYREVGGR